MIVVTGSARSGTSMMMQTLQILGVPIVGEDFSETNRFAGNVKGYYELPPEEIAGGIKNDRFEGKGVKLFGQGLLKTEEQYIDKVIICERNREDSIKSFMRLLRITPVDIAPIRSNAEQIIDINRKIVDSYAKVSDKPVFRVSFKGMLYSAEKVIKNLCEFLGIEPSEEQLKEASENVMRGK